MTVGQEHSSSRERQAQTRLAAEIVVKVIQMHGDGMAADEIVPEVDRRLEERCRQCE